MYTVYFYSPYMGYKNIRKDCHGLISTLQMYGGAVEPKEEPPKSFTELESKDGHVCGVLLLWPVLGHGRMWSFSRCPSLGRQRQGHDR